MNLSLPQNLEYITNSNNNTQYIQMPLKEWEDFLFRIKQEKQIEFLREKLKQGFAELREIQKGNLKERTLAEVLAEL